jgi:Tfp pilus assembly pilus retraction ATPase PilT
MGRYRVELTLQRGTELACIHLIDVPRPSLEALAVPQAGVVPLPLPAGLWLVAGRAGAGRTTTAAALVGHLAETWRGHLVTLEEPVEYVFRHRTATVSQIEVGSDVKTFASAAAAVRGLAAGAIMIDHIDSPERLALAIACAEDGRLVVSTLAARDTADALARLADLSPRAPRLVECVLAQRLVTSGEGSRRAVYEVWRRGKGLVGRSLERSAPANLRRKKDDRGRTVQPAAPARRRRQR